LMLLPTNELVNARNKEVREALVNEPDVVLSMVQLQRLGLGNTREINSGDLEQWAEVLTFRIGMPCILTRNFDVRRQIVNGRTCKLVAFIPIRTISYRTTTFGKLPHEPPKIVTEKRDAFPQPAALRETMAPLLLSVRYPDRQKFTLRGLEKNGFAAELTIDEYLDHYALNLVFCVNGRNLSTYEVEKKHPFEVQPSFSEAFKSSKEVNDSRARNMNYREQSQVLRHYCPVVCFDGDPANCFYVIPPAAYSRNKWVSGREHPIVTQVQCPLLCAAAMTVHRSQSISVSRISIKAQYVSGPETIYVGLTRARDEIYLIGDIPWHRLSPNPEVVAYYRRMEYAARLAALKS